MIRVWGGLGGCVHGEEGGGGGWCGLEVQGRGGRVLPDN